MPNHVTSYINSNNIAAVAALLIDPETNEVDFNRIVPMPDGMLNITKNGTLSSLRKLYGKPGEFDTGEVTEHDLKTFRAMNSEDFRNFAEALYFYTTTGHFDWYEWAIANWGTKWNAYSSELAGDQIIFDTAWSTPEELFEALIKKLPPGTTLSIHWSDEGGPEGQLEYKAE